MTGRSETSDALARLLEAALDPDRACKPIAQALGRPVRVRTAKLVRQKPGRRALVAYELEDWDENGTPATLEVLGKLRARGLQRSAARDVAALYDAGFDSHAADGVCVPQVLGIVPELQIWLQRRVPGTPATELFLRHPDLALARRVAEVAHKIQQADVPTKRRHGIADELHILRQRLARLAQDRPAWQVRLARVMKACEHLGGRAQEDAPRGIHRDFHPDQLLVNGRQVHVVDLDLYCIGPRVLDAGNFIAHLTELALREMGDAAALAECERVLEERFLELAGADLAPALHAYTVLSLVRHVQLSSEREERRHCTEALLDLCEERLGIASSGGPR